MRSESHNFWPNNETQDGKIQWDSDARPNFLPSETAGICWNYGQLIEGILEVYMTFLGIITRFCF